MNPSTSESVAFSEEYAYPYSLVNGQETKMPIDKADHVLIQGVTTPYNILSCQSRDHADLVVAELTQNWCQSLPKFIRLSNEYLAFQETGVSFRTYLRVGDNLEKFFKGNTLLDYRKVLIDILEGYSILMPMHIKCTLSLDSIFIEGGPNLRAKFTKFELRHPCVNDRKSQWRAFAEFVKEINTECGYDSQACPMREFLGYLEQGEERSIKKISVLPLFWDTTKKFDFIMDVVDSVGHGFPPDWETTAQGDPELINLLASVVILQRRCRGPGTEEELMWRIETLFPEALTSLRRLAKKSNLSSLLPKSEKRLRNLFC